METRKKWWREEEEIPLAAHLLLFFSILISVIIIILCLLPDETGRYIQRPYGRRNTQNWEQKKRTFLGRSEEFLGGMRSACCSVTYMYRHVFLLLETRHLMLFATNIITNVLLRGFLHLLFESVRPDFNCLVRSLVKSTIVLHG